MLITPEIKSTHGLAVKNHLREREANYFSALSDLGESLRKGRNPHDWVGYGTFTGMGLCEVATRVMADSLNKVFQYAEFEIASAAVKVPNKEDGQFGHCWLRVIIGKERLFVDGTYGQINSRLDRIVIDSVYREKQYYDYYRRPYITISRKSDLYDRAVIEYPELVWNLKEALK